MAEFLASVSPDIPWHVTAFHQDYKMTDPDDTPASTLIRAAEIGHEQACASSTAGTCRATSVTWRTPIARTAANCSSSATDT